MWRLAQAQLEAARALVAQNKVRLERMTIVAAPEAALSSR